MDFKGLCDSFSNMACVVSVEKKKDGYGQIRLVEGNEKYKNTFTVQQAGSPHVLKEFIPNSIYTDYIEKNLSFEEYSYKSAVKKEMLHSYAYPKSLGVWFHMLYIPIEYETDTLAYCLYVMDVHSDFDSNILSNASNEIAKDVLKTTLQLSNSSNFIDSLNNVVKDIREMCNAQFCCILIIDEQRRELIPLAESRDAKSKRGKMSSYIDDDFYEIVLTWYDTIGDNNCVIINDEKGMEFLKDRNLKWYESLKSSSVDSLVLVPLKSSNKLIGYMWVNNFSDIDTVKIKETLEITTFILESEISNYLLLQQLKELSSIDVLTSLYNRNEMNNYMNRLLEAENDSKVGLLFLDINGLKQVNDIGGHLKGDALIKNAAKTLKSIFKSIPIFRSGGDEFIIIIEDATEKRILDYIKKIREVSAKNNISFAIGYSLRNSKKEVLQALKEADENMYEDKREYYKGKR